MEIVIVSQGLPFGPDTIEHRSLGGSESAALMMAKEMRKLGHLVTIFCNLPPAGMPDYIDNGAQDDLGVRWVQFEQYSGFISRTEVDLLIVSRNPDLFNIPHQAKKAVLWLHDLATYQGLLPRLMQNAWNFTEIWTVSEYHKKQIHEVTGYPLEFIKATRNGIVKFDSVLDLPREPRTLMYSARPERGLENLVRPGGIMDQLPDFTLNVTMYENYPEHMMQYYQMLWSWCEERQNVNLLGPKTQLELRQMMRTHWAYIYPTAFEEVSCILARECIEQGLPFITTTIGALEETLGECGIFYECTKEEIAKQDFCDRFASMVQTVWDSYVEEAVSRELVGWHRANKACEARTDLYWDEVAQQWDGWASPSDPTTYSLVQSLIKDSDIIAADAVLVNHADDNSPGMTWLRKQIEDCYPFLTGKRTFEEHYRLIYELETQKGVQERKEMRTLKGTARYNSIAQEVSMLPEGADVLDYGCAEGPIILQLAQDFPDKRFIGIDFVEDNIRLCNKFAKENNIRNVLFCQGSVENWPDDLRGFSFDGAIISEVLEHVLKPWEVVDAVERYVGPGGKMIITVPQGPWEWQGLKGNQWLWRAHIWHINKWMLRHMFDEKEGCTMAHLSEGVYRDGRSLGHLVMAYTADAQPCRPVDPLEKARQHRCRQSLAAVMIAMNEDDTILRTLNSVADDIDIVQIALGPCSDHTREYIERWAAEHPWIDFRIKDVPKIEAKVFGFDDARNKSMEGVEADWVLWIDSDEYLSGDGIQVFLKENCFDSYAIHQHHFTCEPRGEPAQLDKPARLMRNDGRFQFFGKVHEHAELGFNGGPGFVMVLPNIDIGHTGYVNNTIRIDRFSRNYPLLEWDQEVYPQRRLGRYLWLRDMIHRVRMLDNQGAKSQARRLAEEAIEFYKEHAKDFEGIGAGSVAGNNALAYYGEALKYLGRGYPMAVQIQLEDKTAGYQGIFESEDEALEIAKRAMAEEIRKRKSGYWQ